MKAALTKDHGLTWTLLLLESAERAGLAPIDSVMLHRVQFLSNTLAPIYDTAPPLDLVAKSPRGPYYPSTERDADKLAVLGLVLMADVKWQETSQGVSKWAHYELTQKGLSLCHQFRRDLEWCRTISSFLQDLCFAAASLDSEEIKTATLSDLTYGKQGQGAHAVISLDPDDGNRSADAAKAFKNFFPTNFNVTHRQQLTLYMGFLNELETLHANNNTNG